MRKLKLTFLAVICGLFFLASLAQAQQADAMFGFGTLMSPGAAACNNTTGCPEKGGLYPNIGADVITHKRIGFAFDVAWKASQGAYGGAGGTPFRPILLDFNADYQPKLGKKVGLDLFSGIGVQSTRFYSGYSCNYFGCTVPSVHHFLVDFGGGLRYYVYKHAFVRPEARYYWIDNNTDQFSGNNILRVGVSIGYTIGND